MKVPINVEIDSHYLNDLKKSLDTFNTTEVVRTALSVLSWVIERREEGKIILASTEEGTKIDKLVYPIIDNIKKTNEEVLVESDLKPIKEKLQQLQWLYESLAEQFHDKFPSEEPDLMPKVNLKLRMADDGN